MAPESGKAQQRAVRNARLVAALRENLKRRKAQARGRAQSGNSEAGARREGDDAGPSAPDFRRNRGRD